jgi:biotin--protein ligase
MRQKIAIYEGEGALLLGLRGLDAEYLSREALLYTAWESRVSHFVLPGGRDRPYHAAFLGEGNRRIRTFVENGGIFVGICAGAYYGCSAVEFEKGLALEVCETRELSFFPGKAVGPAYGKGIFAYDSEQGARAARLTEEQGEFTAYYNGGCTFEGDFTGVKILARFADLPGQPPAVIECSIGKGKAVLSGVHLETRPEILDGGNPFLKPVIPLLFAADEMREAFLMRVCPKLSRRSGESGDGKSSALSQGRYSSTIDNRP